MSTGQLDFLKKLADGQGFNREISVNSEPDQLINSKKSNAKSSSYQSSSGEEEEKGYDDDDDDDDDDNGDDYSDEEKDDDDDKSSYESETLDSTENDDNTSSESQNSSQVSPKLVTKNEAASTSLEPEKDEEIDEIQNEQNLESINKAQKSVSFDGICKSKDVTRSERSSNTTIIDSLVVHKDGRKKMMRQENINLGVDEENIASLSVSKASSTASISSTDSTQTSNEPSLGNSQRNSLMRIPCQELTSILDNSSSKLSTIKERRQRQNVWSTPVSIDERLDQNYQELYQLMTRDVEVKGKARQFIHAHQMEQLYEKYISVSYGKIPPITLYPHNWPQCVIRRLFCPTLSTLHSGLTNHSNTTSFMKPTYMIPRSALSFKNDSSMKKTKKAKESKDTRSSSKLNNPMSLQDNQKLRQSSNDQPVGNSSSAHFVDHRLGHSTNPDILKWLNGKNQIFWKQKREEKVQKKLEKETKRLEILRKAERKLQSQQAVYNWMQQKLKENRLSSSEEKSCGEKKSEMKKTSDAYLCHDAFADVKVQQDKDCKLKSQLKPLQSQIKTNKEGKNFTVKNSHFKHMESTLCYDAWTRQTENEICAKAPDSKGSIKSNKKIGKNQESHYSTNSSECLGKEKENISLQENGIKSSANEERQQMIRPKTARRTHVKHFDTSNFLDVLDIDKNQSHSEEEGEEEEKKKQSETLIKGNTSRFNESASHNDFDLDGNNSQNKGNKELEIIDNKN